MTTVSPLYHPYLSLAVHFASAKIALSRESAFVTFGASKVKKRNVFDVHFFCLSPD
jgi:hypothetical protein